jgi:transposase-like protein
MGALAEVYPEASEQRCWNHKITNVLDTLPRKVRNQASEYLRKIPYAETKEECEKLRDNFVRRYSKWYPKATDKLLRDWERMVSFYNFPKEHWRHIRTTNVVESPFSAVRLRTDAAKRYKNVSNATCPIWRLLMIVEKRFQRLTAPYLLAEVYQGVKFFNGKKVLPEKFERRAA